MNASTLTTLYGPFTVIVDDQRRVAAAGWVDDPAALAADIGVSAADIQVREDLGAVTEALTAYFDGRVDALDGIDVAPHSGDGLVARSWGALRNIQPGTTRSYAELASAAGGSPDGARAAARACSTNNVMLFVPCHRIVRSDGSEGEYRYGADVKRALLDFERRSVSSTVPA
jgi:methylated-DNA-[protein]-cysteine S-methyltransferase